MAFKKKATAAGSDPNKLYFWSTGTLGNGINVYAYVTADTPAVIEISGYFDDDELKQQLKPGDKIEIWQVAAISDTRTIAADIAAGFVDHNTTFVVAASGSGVNVSPMAYAGTIEYTLP